MKDLKIHASLLLVVPTPNVVYLEIHRLVHVCLNLWEHRRTADPSVYPTLSAPQTRLASTRNVWTPVQDYVVKMPFVGCSVIVPCACVTVASPEIRLVSVVQ